MVQSSKVPSSNAWIEIDLQAVRHNFRQIRRLARQQLTPRFNRNIDILSVVKADSYGHGMIPCVGAIEKEGGKFFAVSNVSEGAKLRKAGCPHPILLLEATLPETIKDVIHFDLTPCVCTCDFARKLDAAARRAGKRIAVHVKLDTGMSRLGVPQEEAVGFITGLARLKNISLEGLLTHFAVADTDKLVTERQMIRFADVLADLIEKGLSFKYLHAANSMGTVAYQNRMFNLSRPGVMLYGLYPTLALQGKISLKPAMSVKARVLLTKVIGKGAGVSYGHTLKVKKNTPVAVVSIGYSDGYFRSLSNKGKMLINGQLCPILGRVTMDQTIVDISKAGHVRIGDVAVVIGHQKRATITVEDVAMWAATINYEVTCNLGNRLDRVLINK